MEKIKNLIVGSGLSGAVLARKIAEEKKEKVLIIDRRNHIGGNIYDYKDEETNITIHKYGPHVFHTSIKEVWDFLSRFTKWHYFFYKVRAYIDGKEVNIPFNLDSLYKVFPKKMALNLEKKLLKYYEFDTKITILELRNSKDEDLKFLAEYIYKKVFLGYTSKQWGVDPEHIDASVSARVPIYISKDDRYFQDTYQAIPKGGYTKMVENILNHPLIELRLNVDFKEAKKELDYERLFYTGAIDEFFDYKFGKLPYRSLDIKFEKYDKEYMQSCAQMNYPNNFDFTRSVEYKYYLDEKSKKTMLSYEFPCEFEEGKNERYYPIPNEENQKLYERYLQEVNEFKNVYFLGRLGDYKYYDMDKTVDRVLEFVKKGK
ncbi:UDP-galactopyranose mutase [Campylobacter molothri]|uniref:UDP-galactopyranose mutase n=1 Tax=Campylobacter molothri TaxID=1032242 RepID=UPI001DF2BE5A|nr:UDP-galactopyranose mutase [Campylobacter sp. W0045]